MRLRDPLLPRHLELRAQDHLSMETRDSNSHIAHHLQTRMASSLEIGLALSLLVRSNRSRITADTTLVVARQDIRCHVLHHRIQLTAVLGVLVGQQALVGLNRAAWRYS